MKTTYLMTISEKMDSISFKIPYRLFFIPSFIFIKHMFVKRMFLFVTPKDAISYKVKRQWMRT